MSMVILRLLLFLLPFLLFFGWLWLMRRSKRAEGELDERTERRIVGAAVAGIVVMIGGFFAFAAIFSADPSRDYVPPRFEDGEIKPGRFEGRGDETAGGDDADGG